MNSRRSPRQIKAGETWTRFVEANAEQILAAGLPRLATVSIAHWDDLLMHGRFDHHHDPGGFSLTALTESQYSAYVALVDSYFAYGYEYFTPRALREEDQRRLAARHAGPGTTTS